MDASERNRRRSERLKARWADPEARAKLERNSINADCPEWLRTQRSERMKRRWADRADRDRLATLMTRPETKLKRSERSAAYWADPARRQEHSRKVSAALLRPEVRKARRERRPTCRTLAQRLVAELLNSPTPEIEPPKNPVTISRRRFGETHRAAVSEYPIPTGTVGDDE